MGPADSYMNTTEIILLAAFLQLVTLACCFMAIREAWLVAAENFRKWQVALQAYRHEKEAHAKTNARLIEEMRLHKERYL